MKILVPLLFLVLIACNDKNAGNDRNDKPDSTTENGVTSKPSTDPLQTDTTETYANQRFKEVRAEQVNDSTFRITGKGQIFEARFGWVIEDGHNELEEGYESTSAGAPAWGDFSFLVAAQKQRSNSTLHLVLFETSAKDGSRQHQLPIPLY